MLSSASEPARPTGTEPELEGPSFRGLGLTDGVLRAVKRVGLGAPTAVQMQTIPPALAGRDVWATAPSGAGKTASFVLPMVQRLLFNEPSDRVRRVRALVLVPSRELAAPIGESVAAFGAFTRFSHTVVFGGVSQEPQVQEINRGVDVLVATPARLGDLLQQRLVRLPDVEILVIDALDVMVEQGQLASVRKVVSSLPASRQTLLFAIDASKEVETVAKGLLRSNPVRVSVDVQVSAPTEVHQSVWFVDSAGKRARLEQLLSGAEVARALVFTRTKHGADRVTRHLERAGIPTQAIHGSKSENNRQRTLDDFREGGVRVLVATDVAARGLEIAGVTHVINYELPADPENYVQRIGRIARGQRTGVAVSLCSPDERAALSRIERTIGHTLHVQGGTRPATLPPPRAPSKSVSAAPLTGNARVPGRVRTRSGRAS